MTMALLDAHLRHLIQLAAKRELVEGIDTLQRAIGVLDREMKKSTSFVQGLSAKPVMQALEMLVQGSVLGASDASRLSALIQSRRKDTDDSEFGAPAGAVYKSRSGGIVDVLEDLLDESQRQLAAARKGSRNLIDDANSIIEGNAELFGSELAPEILVFFAEAASEVQERDAAASHALDLYFRKHVEEDQFTVRAYFVRCKCEARLGTNTYRLRGLHLLQQLKYALSFLEKALAIATKKTFDEKYGFLVYNASLVYWEVSRPLNRKGWQQHLWQEASMVLDRLRDVYMAGRGGPVGAADKGGKPAKAGAGENAGMLIPVPATTEFTIWLIELTLNVAFGLDDKGAEVEAGRRADEAVQLLALLPETEADALRMHIYNAKAYFGRRQPAAVPKLKEEVDKAIGGAVAGTAFLVSNGAIAADTCEEELIKAWITVDPQYDLRGKRDAFNPKIPHGEAKKAAEAAHAEGGPALAQASHVMDLALLLRATCVAERFPLARAMLTRLETCRIPAGRAKILIDLSKAEHDVWYACTVRLEDPRTDILLHGERQVERELDARFHAVRLCEQCVMVAKRLGEMDLVEDSAVTLWNLGRELMCDQHRLKIHKSLMRTNEILREIQTVWLVELRVQYHFECARCEMAQELLTKAQSELRRLKMLDYTLPESALDREEADGAKRDMGPSLRRFDQVTDEQLNLIHWKLNTSDGPTDAGDHVMLLLDQVSKAGPFRKEHVLNLLSQGYEKLRSGLDGLEARLAEMGREPFAPPERHITSMNPREPLPNQAPATVKQLNPGAAEISLGGGPPQPILDQRPKHPWEEVLARLKRAIMLMCRLACEAVKAGHYEFAATICKRAIESGTRSEAAFEPPIQRVEGAALKAPIQAAFEVEGAALLAETWYAKARCLSVELAKLGVISGIDDGKVIDDASPDEPEEPAEQEGMTQTQIEMAVSKKKELITALLEGIRKSFEFRQWWLLVNGIAHWWNFHLELVERSYLKPSLLAWALDEYREGLREIMNFFTGPDIRLPDSDFDSALAAKITMAHFDAGCAVEDWSVLETDNVLVLRRLTPEDRKEVMARLTRHCRKNDRPLPELTRLRSERAEAAAAAAAPSAPAAGKKPPAGAAQVPDVVDKTDFSGNEIEVMMLVESIAYAKDPDMAKRWVDDAFAVLGKWEPRPNDEQSVTLWVELWTRLGRQCLGDTMKASVGPKAALACCIRGLGRVDLPMPKHASPARLRWRGACHALCGQTFARTVEQTTAEKDSQVRLRCMSVEQFSRCCEHAVEIKDEELAVFGAKSLWNVALPLLHSVDTRQYLIKPLRMATRALTSVHYKSDPEFFVALFTARYECYSDLQDWDAVHEMLEEAFPVIPTVHQRRLWAIRMISLSRQGKNVVGAMGKMRETEPKSQADIWVVLANASSRRADQLGAYAEAITILQDAQHKEVAEVRMQFADWLLRNGFDVADVQKQLAAAADVFLGDEQPSDDDDDAGGIDEHTTTSLGTRSRSGLSSTMKGKSRAEISQSTLNSLYSKATKTGGQSSCFTAADGLGDQDGRLYPHHCELLVRLYTHRSRFSTNGDFHFSLLEAAHFAHRFFASSVDLVNAAKKELSAIAGQEPLPEAKFVVPVHFGDWADEAWWQWRSETFKDVLQRAEHAELIDKETESWAGIPEAFQRPSLSFHALTQLVDDLVDHGYLLWAFPVLALQAELADVFTGITRTSIAVFVRMRMSRLAADCGLHRRAAVMDESWVSQVDPLLSSFGQFKEELDKVASQRSGRPLHADFYDSPNGRWIYSAWTCDELHVYQVWAAFSKECVLNGELYMACLLSDEAEKHAEIYGDRRTIRSLHMTKAIIAYLEGRYLETVSLLRRISAADLQQTYAIALLSAKAYMALNEPARADRLLQDAYKTVQKTRGAAAVTDKSGDPQPLSTYTLAECTVRAARLNVEVSMLRTGAVTSSSWATKLASALTQMLVIGSELHNASLFRHHVLGSLEFANNLLLLMEAKQADLVGDNSLHVDKGSGLSFEYLARQGDQLCVALGSARKSRDALLKSVVPIEGVELSTVTPVEVLSMQLEVCLARVMATCRALRLHASAHRKGRQSQPAQQEDFKFFRIVPLHPGKGDPDDIIDRPLSPEGRIRQYISECDVHIEEQERMASHARVLDEAEASAILVSGAYATVCAFSSGEAEAALPPYIVEAHVELGRLQLELALQNVSMDSVWDTFAQDPFELAAMKCAERSSNVLKNTHVDEIFKLPATGDPEGADSIFDEGRADDVPLDEVAKETLCEALSEALVAHHFISAKRALQKLALEAYGTRCPEATFEFLIWLQSVDVCMRAEDILLDVLPETHYESVQLRTLRQLDSDRLLPQSLTGYRTILNRLRRESPFFQRLDLVTLPSINDLLLSYVPPFTLVVTLQLHAGFLYIGAARSPAADGEQTVRLAMLRHKVVRLKLSESEVRSCVTRLQELNQALEKKLALVDGLDEAYEMEYLQTFAEAERVIAQPIALELASHFWPVGVGIKHPANPQQLMLLPDANLWGFPLERMAPLMGLFGHRSYGSLSRDFSLHVAAQRVRRVVETEAGLKPVQLRMPTVKSENTVLLTDALNEDVLRSSDAPNAETAFMMHKRLVEGKLVTNDRLCFPRLHEPPFDASPKDVMAMLFGCSAFYALSFGRSLHAIDTGSFAAMDLSRVSLLAIFGRCVNEKAFRRQTKADSLKTPRLLAAENEYGFPLMAAFRGAQCTVVSAAAMPTCFAMRALDVFLRSMKGGRSVGEAMEDVLSQPCTDVSARYTRPPQGGAVPVLERGPSRAGGVANPAADDAVELLPLHTKAAWMVVGAPWVTEDGVAPGGKPKR